MKTQLIGVLLLLTLLRVVGLILGCWYGPFIYIVIPLGVLYLALDVLTLFMVRVSDMYDWEVGIKVTKWAWIGCNVVAVLGLLVAIILYLVHVGFWGMTYYPIHICMFILIILLSILIVVAMVLLLKSLKASNPHRGAGNRDYEGLKSANNHVVTY